MVPGATANARRIAVALGIVFATVACDEASQLRKGMREAEVTDMLGTATEVITETSLMQEFFVKEDVKSCLPKAAKVLVYDRWINDVSVAVDASGTVLCFESLQGF